MRLIRNKNNKKPLLEKGGSKLFLNILSVKKLKSIINYIDN